MFSSTRCHELRLSKRAGNGKPGSDDSDMKICFTYGLSERGARHLFGAKVTSPLIALSRPKSANSAESVVDSEGGDS